MKKQGKTEVTLPQAPYVDPKLANSPAARYAADLAARKGGGMVGGGPTPPIPRIDAPPIEGMTMADQARAFRQSQTNTPSIISPEGMPQSVRQSLLHSDMLPEAARSDPMYREGTGSMMATSQPALAYKYGVIRNGSHIPPQMLQTGRPMLSPQTVNGLKALEDYNRQHVDTLNQARKVAESPTPESDATAGTSGEVAKLADPSDDPTAKPVTQEEVEKAIRNMDDFDFDTFRDVIMKDILNNEEQRSIVESRLEPLDLSEIINNGVIAQKIPIVPGKYEITLQSVTAEEELAMKRLLVEEKGKLEAPDRYLLDKFRMMMCALGLKAINNRALPDHKDNQGNFNDEAFWKKFNICMKNPFHMLASIATHYYYFDIRVRSLFKAVKNG